MITLEGYEIEEMRSINHIMTVELQFKTPMTQKEARDYLSRVLAKANKLEAQAQKEDVKEYLEKTKNSLEELTFAFPQKEETANENPEIANENPEIANDDVINEENLAVKKKQIANAFGVPEAVLEDIDGTWPPAADVKKPEKTEGVLKVPVTEEEIANMKQKKIEEEAKAEKYKKIDWDKACALKKAGWSNKQIAEGYTSISRSTTPEKGRLSMKKKPKHSLYERIEYMTGKKIVICAAEDKEILKKRFPFRTRIVVAAGQAPGGYRIVDMERLKEAAYKMAKTLPPITIEPVSYKNMWNTKGLKGEPIQQNVVIKIDKGQQS